MKIIQIDFGPFEDYSSESILVNEEGFIYALRNKLTDFSWKKLDKEFCLYVAGYSKEIPCENLLREPKKGYHVIISPDSLDSLERKVDPREIKSFKIFE